MTDIRDATKAGRLRLLGARRVRAVGLVAVLLTLGGTACDGPNPQFGLRLENGAVAVHFKPCHGDTHAFDVCLEESGRDAPLWHITSEAGSGPRRFTLGMTPPEFREVVPLTEPIPQRFLVAISTEPDGRNESSVDAEWVELKDLSPDGIFVPLRGSKSTEEFADYETCG